MPSVIIDKVKVLESYDGAAPEVTTADIVDATAAGRDLLTAANAEAQAGLLAPFIPVPPASPHANLTLFEADSDGNTSSKLVVGELADSDVPADIRHASIGNSVTSIGGYAFANNSLTSVTIPNSVTSIGSNAFQSNSLTSVTIPDSVTTIGNSAFAYNSLTSVTIGNSVTTIGSSAFVDNSLTSLTIPNSVTSIGSSAFRYNSLTSVTIPDSVTSIGSSAFRYNSLTSVTIPNSVTTIGSNAFAYNSSLATIDCYAPLTSIGSYAFYQTASPLTINVPTSGAVSDTWTEGTGLTIGGNTNVTVIKNL